MAGSVLENSAQVSSNFFAFYKRVKVSFQQLKKVKIQISAHENTLYDIGYIRETVQKQS